MKKRTWIILGAIAALLIAGIIVFFSMNRECDGPEEEWNEMKPIIYLYPEEETEVTVTLGEPQNITCAYPAYGDGWTVVARPDGTLTDLKTGRNLYALYWEGTRAAYGHTDEGFVVRGEDSAAFLEEKLSILGLNERRRKSSSSSGCPAWRPTSITTSAVRRRRRSKTICPCHCPFSRIR